MKPEAEKLVNALNDLRLRAGMPSARSIGEALQGISRTTVADTFRGVRVPSWVTCSAIVRHMGGDVEEFRELWMAARRATDEDTSTLAEWRTRALEAERERDEYRRRYGPLKDEQA